MLNFFVLFLTVCWQEENLEPNMIFLQLPPTLPLKKQPATGNERQVTESSSKHEGATAKEKTSSMSELPGGFMGKLLVYRSGAVKLKLGETVYNVSKLHSDSRNAHGNTS